MIYKWKYGVPVKASVAGAEMERIEKKHGMVTPKILLDESRRKGAKLHSLFEWDDTIAAENYRLKQAQNIIHNLTIIVEGAQEKPLQVAAFVNVSTGVKGEYINVQNAFTYEETRQIVLDRALRELAEFQRKYKNLEELAHVFESINELREVA